MLGEHWRGVAATAQCIGNSLRLLEQPHWKFTGNSLGTRSIFIEIKYARWINALQ
jgi:hypothetical protein